MNLLDSIIAAAETRRTSDIHIAAGLPVRFRIDGELTDVDDHVLSAAECEALAREAVGDAYDAISECGELDMAGTYAGHVRCRFNIYQSMRGPCLAIRLLSNSIPDLSTLGLGSSPRKPPSAPRATRTT